MCSSCVYGKQERQVFADGWAVSAPVLSKPQFPYLYYAGNNSSYCTVNGIMCVHSAEPLTHSERSINIQVAGYLPEVPSGIEFQLPTGVTCLTVADSIFPHALVTVGH